MKISGKNKFTNSQIVETAERDVVLNVGVDSRSLNELVGQVEEICNRYEIKDTELEALLKEIQANAGNKKQAHSSLENLSKYYVKLKSLLDSGSEVLNIGKGAAAFVKELGSLLSGSL